MLIILHNPLCLSRGAYKWWSNSLDTLLGMSDAIHKWRRTYKTDVSVQLLNHCGLWGCLLGGVLASNMAQSVQKQQVSSPCINVE